MTRRRLPGGGFLDLLVVAMAVMAVWTRTPVGALGQWGVAWMRGQDTANHSLLRTFRTDAAPAPWATETLALPTLGEPGDGFPEPFRSAVLHGLPGVLPPHTTTLVDEPTPEAVLEWLDTNWDGDAERALEHAAIGAPLTNRAIERATAAGVERPERFSNHRRFLSVEDEKHAARLLDPVLGLAVVFDLHWPVDPTIRISSPFGYRNHPTLGKRKFHNGVDLPVAVGTPLHAVQSGTIRKAGENNVSGKYVILDHEGGISSAYCHMSALPDKQTGDRVERGENIGASGNTGRSTGPHLHFVLRVAGEPVDPAPFRRPRP